MVRYVKEDKGKRHYQDARTSFLEIKELTNFQTSFKVTFRHACYIVNQRIDKKKL